MIKAEPDGVNPPSIMNFNTPAINKAKIILAVILVIGMFVVAFQNRAPVETRLLVATVTMPLFVLVLMTAGFGFLLGALLTWALMSKRGKQRDK